MIIKYQGCPQEGRGCGLQDGMHNIKIEALPLLCMQVTLLQVEKCWSLDCAVTAIFLLQILTNSTFTGDTVNYILAVFILNP